MAWYKCSGGGEGIPLITKSGNIVEYEDTVGGIPINDLTAEIVPKQASGTPTPTNPLPISGYTEGVLTNAGENLFDKKTYSEWSQSNSYLYLNEIVPSKECIMSFYDNDTSVDVSGCYIGFASNYSGSGSLSLNRWCLENGTVKSTRINTTSGVLLTGIVIYPKTEETYNKIFSRYHVQVSFGSSDLQAYHAYVTPTTETRLFGQTVYGGTWKASEGKVENKKGIVDLGTLSWTKVSGTGKVYSTFNDMKSTDGQVINDIESSEYKSDSWDNDYCISHFNKVIRINNPNFQSMTESQIANELSGVQACYPLATPTEISVEPVNLTAREGTNNVFANTGNLTAKFYKSTVDNLETLVEQTKDLAPDMIALASSGNKFDLTDDTTGTKATKIANYMFYKNANVENISLSTIEEVGEYSFEDCKYIKGINLPNCTTLKKEAFYNACQSHTSTTLPSVAINLPKVTVVNDRSLSQIGYANGLTATLVLTACTEIKANGIRGMGSAYMRINELLLPNLVTLGQESFNYNVIETFDIGENCTTINSKPFDYCTITNLIVRATTPPTLHNNGLGVTPTHIYVPSASVETYKTTSNWSTYASVIEAIPS